MWMAPVRAGTLDLPVSVTSLPLGLWGLPCHMSSSQYPVLDLSNYD